MTTRSFSLAFALVVLTATHADAQSRNARGGRPGDRGTQVTSAGPRGMSTEVEIRLIRDYYSAQPKKPKSLPPGIAKNLARGKPLPPGIAKTRVPDDLIVLLPVRTGTRWVLAGDVVLLVDAGDVIVDLVRLIF